MVDKSSSVPLYLQIQNIITEAVRSGEYQPGTQVPSELEISSRFNVSRMTARKALDNLVAKGMLYRRRGKGTYVAESIVSYGLSTMLSFSQTLRARGYDVVTKVLLMEVIPAPPEVLDNLQLGVNGDVIIIRRLRLIEDKPAAIHTAFLDFRRFASILDYDLNSESLLDAIQDIIGVHVAYARDSVRADLATDEEAKLLHIEPRSAVLRLEGTAHTDSGQPTRYSRAVYRGDMFEFVVKNSAELATTLKIASDF